MNNQTLPHFGKLDAEHLDAYYMVNMDLDGRSIEIDLNFENKAVDAETFDLIRKFMEDLKGFDERNLGYINEDFSNEDGEVVKEYITFHLEELGDDFLEQLHLSNVETDKAQAFLSKLTLSRVGIYPDTAYGTSNFAVFDYTVSREHTDQLIVVATDNQGNLSHLSWES